MVLKAIIIIVGLLGFLSGHLGFNYFLKNQPKSSNNELIQILNPLSPEKNQVIGFLPFWLLDKADKDYEKYLTTLAYFGLTIAPDGTIEKYSKDNEEEPGWYALHSGKVDPFINSAKENNLNLSLLVFSADEEVISQLINDPVSHARNLVDEVAPIMKKYGFADLNLDIESVHVASDTARQNFTAFVKEVKKNLNRKNLGTLTIDASPIVLLKKYLINLNEVGNLADYTVLMTYDFHYQGSFVTGPVSPVGGVLEDAEYDSETAVKIALDVLPPNKILLGVPLYGYEWEALGDKPRLVVIPGTGVVASNRRVEELIKSCTDCSVSRDKLAKESYLTYKDNNTNTYHQIFYPDISATSEKVRLANHYKIGGVALWALGYEGSNILEPLAKYLQNK